MHGTFGTSSIQIEPAILYFGTPVVLIGTRNEDDSFNLAPMSSAWWVGWRCMLGLAQNSKTTENIIRTGECVLNLPSAGLVDSVDRLARTTGSDPVPPGKLMRGYRHEKAKFGVSGFTAQPGDTVAAPRALQCPVQIEAKLPDIMMDHAPDRIDPDKWRPLIMSFQQFYGLTQEKLQHSELGQIPEAMYKPPGWRPTL